MTVSRALGGTLASASAFMMWGLLPIYWKALKAVPPDQILCHRIVWSAVFVAVILTVQRRWDEVRAILRSRRTTLLFLLNSCVVSFNWLLYIWAVNNDHVVESSLGYYINPLVFLLFGFIFFRDRLRPLQWLAIGFAATGVGVSVLHYGRMPWVALLLAVSFGLYGLIRKVVAAESMPGLFFETATITPVAAVYLWWAESQGVGALGHLGWSMDLLMAGAGLVTSLPLLLFAFAARRISLVTLGITQYFSPTGMFLLGVFLYGEPFDAWSGVTFGLIWVGVLLYLVESIAFFRRVRHAAAQAS